MTPEEVKNFYINQAIQDKKRKIEEYKRRNKFVVKGQILFVGSSLMENFPINELIQPYDLKKIIYNRGIGGFVLQEFENNLSTCVLDLAPAKLFVNIGSNDLNDENFDVDMFIIHYKKILLRIKEQFPNIRIYILGFYPVNYDVANEYMKKLLLNRNNDKIKFVNEKIQILANEIGAKFINLNETLMDESGNLKAEFSMDGMHFYADGYHSLMETLIPFIEE